MTQYHMYVFRDLLVRNIRKWKYVILDLDEAVEKR